MTELERFKIVLATICLQQPNLTLSEALVIADDIFSAVDEMVISSGVARDFNEETPHETVDRWLRTQRDIASMPKIVGIKEIRARTHLGLKAAKDAHERVFPFV